MLIFLVTSVIAGNHDVTMHPDYYKEHWERFPHHRRYPEVSIASTLAIIRSFLPSVRYQKKQSPYFAARRRASAISYISTKRPLVFGLGPKAEFGQYTDLP